MIFPQKRRRNAVKYRRFTESLEIVSAQYAERKRVAYEASDKTGVLKLDIPSLNPLSVEPLLPTTYEPS